MSTMIGEETEALDFSQARPLKDIIDGRNFEVPLYQRSYKWGTAECERLIKDLIANCKEGKTKSIGLITLIAQDNVASGYQIIDGQQRFITLSIIFSLLGYWDTISLSFARDNANDPIRKNAIIDPKNAVPATDTDRIKRNSEAIDAILKKQEDLNKEKLKNFILENCVMLCNVTQNEPLQEFMNLNAFKTKFSVCDYYRAQLIMLNTFYRDELEKSIADVSLALKQSTYKTAVATLYNDILDILYNEKDKPRVSGEFSSVYALFEKVTQDADDTLESRINILFYDEKKVKREKSYVFEPDDMTDVSAMINLLMKLACVLSMLTEIKESMKNGDFSSARAVDDFHRLKKKSFISELMSKDKDTLMGMTLAQALEMISMEKAVNRVVIDQIGYDDYKLANRVFEDYAFDRQNASSDTSAEDKSEDTSEDRSETTLKKMSKAEIVDCMNSIGKYVLNRYSTESAVGSSAKLTVPPVLDLDDKENPDFTDDEIGSGGKISVGDLFKDYNIKIPVIQRDYCMGSQISTEKNDDFLEFLLKNYESYKNDKTQELELSAILVSVTNDKEDVYIFDGQQRTFTLYNILKEIEGEAYGGKKYEFVGRTPSYGSRYSQRAVENLKEALEKRIDEQDKRDFCDFLKDKVNFSVKNVGKVTDAEQFFMDINGGVALKPYEIFKAILCDRLRELNLDYLVRKLENEWLKKVYEILQIKPDDDSDNEELAEMRLIEHLCRYVYRNKIGNTPPAFDTLKSKSDIVPKAQEYINSLEKDDFKKIEDFLDNMFSGNRTTLDIPIFYNGCNSIQMDSYGKTAKIISFKGIEKAAFSELFERLVKSFSSSSDPDRSKRDNLKKIYGFDTEKALVEIYDKDDIFDYIWNTVNTTNEKTAVPPKYSIKEKPVTILAGYNNWGDTPYSLNKRKWDLLNKEPPLYYYLDEIGYYKYNVRLDHDVLSLKTDATLFLLRGNLSLTPLPGFDSFEYDGDITITFSNPNKNSINLYITNRTDAFLLKSGSVDYQIKRILEKIRNSRK